MTADPNASSLPLFYRQPRVLQPAAHGQKSIASQPDFGFAATTNALPLAAEELGVVARHFPIVFTEQPLPHPMAVVGLRAQQNLFVEADGRWREAAYVPAYVRRYPFVFLESETGKELTLCIDEAAPQLVEGRSNPLFDEQGQPTPLTRNALQFCRDFQVQHRLAAEFGQALADAQLLIDNRADISLPSGERLSLSGFKIIDGERFSRLADAEFLRWRDKGWLAMVYAHFFSLGAWSSLLNLVGDSGESAPSGPLQ